MTIAEEAAAKLKEIKKSKDSFEKGDQVWAVFDRDEHPNHESAIELCKRSGVGVARSAITHPHFLARRSGRGC
jgi:hypothetical protein